ncbi:mitochondrial carrier [Dissoconium aciculare CBS 342.82]|uniref:Mitochondrial carrier n=1 Tax=Dissoconium aciculare CBS 342.82 TaxID=1314786 RepID=A0A6J3LZ56_9PEZI|nr:mitochondrial carrier [Dissoconium aciculare CBS 342.82]KAF1821041.1 mitochondrial carrier [Dissoconium aciculare CBS 342.82]
MSKAPVKSNDSPTKIHYPFWFGGSASCFAATVTHPLDLITFTAYLAKVRLQTQSHEGPRKNMTGMASHIIKSDGVRGLYRGLSASIMRQLTYSTTRFGVYEKMKELVSTGKEPPSFMTLVAMASTSGFLGGIAGTPADIINVRMQNDMSLPTAERRNYKNAVDGLLRMVREEGYSSLVRGVWPNSARAVLMTASQLASYDIFKVQILQCTTLGDGLSTHFLASFLAGFVATTVCSPMDVIKTRVMSAKTNEGIFSMMTRITAAEGFGWMWKGWVPSFMRLGPHTIATFIFLEQHKKIYRQLYYKD